MINLLINAQVCQKGTPRILNQETCSIIINNNVFFPAYLTPIHRDIQLLAPTILNLSLSQVSGSERNIGGKQTNKPKTNKQTKNNPHICTFPSSDLSDNMRVKAVKAAVREAYGCCKDNSIVQSVHRCSVRATVTLSCDLLSTILSRLDRNTLKPVPRCVSF